MQFELVSLKEDFSIDPRDYIGINKNIFIANPNAPTGLILTTSDIEEIVKSNPNNIVVVDEAYIDFGGKSAVPLVREYDNLVVTQTFSKSRSMAGARLGFGIACPALINDLYRLIYSTNPYNISRASMAAGIGAVEDYEYTKANCQKIIETRKRFSDALTSLGFEVLPSSANFVFAKSEDIGGRELYESLKEEGILIRHFDKPRINNYVRITIGLESDMDILLEKIKLILDKQ